MDVIDKDTYLGLRLHQIAVILVEPKTNRGQTQKLGCCSMRARVDFEGMFIMGLLDHLSIG